MLGIAKGIKVDEDETTVAVKTLKNRINDQAFQALVSELKILCNLGHHLNIVNLLGAVTKKVHNRELLLILEYCSFGSLYSFLLANRSNFNDDLKFNPQEASVSYIYKKSASSSHAFKTSDLLSWSFQCSQGMEFISSKKLVHGDLAARNVLLCEKNVIKISDFGLSKSLYKKEYTEFKREEDVPLPYKWLAIECFVDNIFSSKTDVWAFGNCAHFQIIFKSLSISI